MEWGRLSLGQLSASRKFPCNEVYCKAPQNPQPNGTSLVGINMVLRDRSTIPFDFVGYILLPLHIEIKTEKLKYLLFNLKIKFRNPFHINKNAVSIKK